MKRVWRNTFSNYFVLFSSVLLAGFLFVGCSDDDEDGDGAGNQTISERINQDSELSTLSDALAAAGLDTVLEGDGPYTIFAPDNDAFDKLPDGVLDELLSDPEGDLATILQYHVVADTLRSDDLEGSIQSILGDSIKVTRSNNSIFLNDSIEIITRDIEATNGVIHIIDGVLIPPEVDIENLNGTDTISVMEYIENNESTSTLEAALKAAGLDSTLDGEGPYTIFAPSDDAFAKLDSLKLDSLLADPSGNLTSILLYHVVDDSLSEDSLKAEDAIVTLNGDTLNITTQNDTITINDTVELKTRSVKVENGVVYVIDDVLIPEDLAE